MYSRSIQRAIDAFAKLPTVGPRTASRFVFKLLKSSDKEVDELVNAIKDLKENMRMCPFCYNPYEEPTAEHCAICRNQRRDRTTLCVVEKESDIEAIEKTNQYKGLYFIFGGTVGMLRQEDLKNVRGEELKKRVSSPKNFGFDTEFKEVIIGINPTTEGEATALYIERILEPLSIKTTRLGRGIPMGGELEYADEETLRSSFEGRK